MDSQKIADFLKIEPIRNGYGNGDGNGDGNGNGYGYGNGDGNGDGYGNGYGNGYGYGNGNGDGYGNGYGNGYGYGNGVKSVNGRLVYLIDGVQTVITSIRGNFVKGFILNSDLTLDPCYIAKNKYFFAHGSTLKEAVNSLEQKTLSNTPIEERINNFKSKFSIDKKYKAIEFFNWHNILTGSCEMGRQSFAHNNGIDLEKDKLSVTEFIKFTENQYGSEIINKLKLSYEIF